MKSTPAQRKRNIIRRNRALTRFSIIDVPEDDSTERRQRARGNLVSLLLTLAIIVALTKALPFWLFLALVILGCLAFYPGGLIDGLLTNFFTKKNKPL